MIESETDYVPEMRTISSVFHNRIRKRMRLQSDPTAIYGIRDFNGDVRTAIRANHPYNTYKIRGLPPGPICSPRIEAIEAAIDPEKTGFLYFVAKMDRSGSHAFSETLREHNRSINKYLVPHRRVR